MKNGAFRIRPIKGWEHGKKRRAFQVVGYLGGERIRKRFKDRGAAAIELSRLQVLAANDGGVRAVNTRLSTTQLAEAEAVFVRLGGTSLSHAVDWFLANYEPPSVAKPLSAAIDEYLADKKPHVKRVHWNDIKRKLAMLAEWYPMAMVHDVESAGMASRMAARAWGNKSWNNVRGALHDFFEYAADGDRRWVIANPVAKIATRDVARGIPHIETAARLGELFEFLETYEGGTRKAHRPGFLVPYFSLATFAGLRPSIPNGEIWKIGQLADVARTVDLEVGVIRISPEIAKTNSVRQVKIRPALAAWLKKYPIKEYPICMPNMQALVTQVRKKFGLSDDVLRHTWISAHVATDKSLGAAALEAGNSESIIRRHYLNLMSDAEAAAFWAIRPARRGLLTLPAGGKS